jgi:simple sugar transport system permease protein
MTSTISTPATVRWAGIRELALLPVIVVVFAFATLFVPYFGNADNIVNNILASAAVLGLLVIAQSVILIGGYFDLSMQSVVGLAPMVAAWLSARVEDGGLGTQIGPAGAIVVIFAIGGAVGLVNGFLVGGLRLNAFIVTLAMLILLQGFTLGISSGQTFSHLPATMTFLSDIKLFGVTLDVWLLVIAFALAAFFMRYHPTGRRIYAMGGSPNAARAAGVRTLRLTIGLFVFGGLMASLAGLALSARIASVTANQGENIIFTVFASAVIGGISLEGGRGSILGAASGVLLLGMIQNILVLSNIPSFWIDATYGAIILGALLIGSEELRRSLTGLLRK